MSYIGKKCVTGVTVSVTVHTEHGDKRVLDLTHTFEDAQTNMMVETNLHDSEGHAALEMAGFALDCALSDIHRAVEGDEGVSITTREKPAGGRLDS